MPVMSEYGLGWWSVYSPITGCSSDAVSWKVKVIRPIWPKSRWNAALSMGYMAGSSACIMSLSRWQKLMARSTGRAVGMGGKVAAAAARVRRFNRFATRRLGLRDEGHLHSPFTLPEVRVLYEVAHRERPTAAAIAGALGVDAGYLSRLLRGLRHRGLVAARVVPHDRRQRVLALTARGRRTFAGLDARATSEVAALLQDLSPAERERLLVSLEEVETLLERGARPRGDSAAP